MPDAATSVSTIAGQMFMPTSVARMPISRPAEPVITPAERSNSPAIMSSATITAGMPIVEATSVQLEMPESSKNRLFWVKKKTPTTSLVERGQLGLRARALDRGLGGLGDVRVERHHRVEGLVGLQLGLDLGLGRRDVRGALDLQVGHVAAEALLDAVAALLEADVVLLVDDAEHLLGALGLQALAGG